MDETELPFTIPTHPPLSPTTASLLQTPIPLPCPLPSTLDTLFHAEHGQLFNLSGLRTSESLILQDLDPYSPSSSPSSGFIHVNEAKWHSVFHRSKWASTTCQIANRPLHIDDDTAWSRIAPAIELADRMLQQALAHHWLLAMLSAAGREAVRGVSATVDGRRYANATIYRAVPGPVTHEARGQALKVLNEIAGSVFWGFHRGDEAPGLLGKTDTIHAISRHILTSIKAANPAHNCPSFELFFNNERWAEAGYSFETAFLGTVLRSTWPSPRSRRKAYHALLAPRPDTAAAGQFQYYGGWAPSDPFVEERAGVPGRVLWEMTREDFWGVRWSETPFAEFQMRSWVAQIKGIGRSVKCEAGVIAAAKKMIGPFGVEEQVCGTRIEGERSGRGFWRAVGFLAMAAVPVRRGVYSWEDESVPAYPEFLVHGASGEVCFPVGYEDERVDDEDADLPSWAIARSGIAGEEVTATVIQHYSPGEIGDLQSLGPGQKVVLWQDEDDTEIQVYDVSEMFPNGWDSDARDNFTVPGQQGRMLRPNLAKDVLSQVLSQQPLGQAMLWRQAEDVQINDGNEGRPNWIALAADVFEITNLHLSPDLHTLHHILARTRNPVEAIDAGFHPDLIRANLLPCKIGWLRDEVSGPRRRDRVFTANEVKWFAARETGMYVVINASVYDLTRYCDMHTGGTSLISQLAGRDATEAWTQAHGHGASVSGGDVHAALEELKIGRVVPEQSSTQPLSSSQIRIRDCVFGRENIKPEQTQALNDLAPYWGTDCTSHLEAQSPHWVLTKLYDTRDFIVAKIAPSPKGFPMMQETLREFDGKETDLGLREAYTSPSPLTASLLTRAGTILTSSPEDTELRTWLQTSCRHRIIASHDHRQPNPGTSNPRWKTDVQSAPRAPAPGHFPKIIKAARVEMNWARALQGDAASPGPKSDVRPTQANPRTRGRENTRHEGGKGRVGETVLPLLNQKPQSLDGDVVMEDVQTDGWTVVGKKKRSARRTRKRV
ncbi:putative cytochrome b5 1 [Colletotrichum sp. SAR11_240]|nr:putative cytochrome b5 1 [Colletotrichum sp. SAR11_240]